MNFKLSLKTAIKSRTFIVLTVFLLIQTIVLVITVSSMTHAGNLQVPVRYTAYSNIQFYRDQWYYLLSFGFFGLAVFIVNSLIAMKLFSEKGRSFAIMYQLTTAVVLFVATVLFTALLRVANLQ